jgi:hypothetical protein
LLRQRLAHANGLAALAGEDECGCHGAPRLRTADRHRRGWSVKPSHAAPHAMSRTDGIERPCTVAYSQGAYACLRDPSFIHADRQAGSPGRDRVRAPFRGGLEPQRPLYPCADVDVWTTLVGRAIFTALTLLVALVLIHGRSAGPLIRRNARIAIWVVLAGTVTMIAFVGALSIPAWRTSRSFTPCRR